MLYIKNFIYNIKM